MSAGKTEQLSKQRNRKDSDQRKALKISSEMCEENQEENTYKLGTET